MRTYGRRLCTVGLCIHTLLQICFLRRHQQGSLWKSSSITIANKNRRIQSGVFGIRHEQEFGRSRTLFFVFSVTFVCNMWHNVGGLACEEIEISVFLVHLLLLKKNAVISPFMICNCLIFYRPWQSLQKCVNVFWGCRLWQCVCLKFTSTKFMFLSFLKIKLQKINC